MSFFSPIQKPISSTRSRQRNLQGKSFDAPRSAMRRGQVLIEAAFIMPILLLFSLGILQFGLVYNAKLALEHACREGARYASIHARDKPIAGPPIQTADDLIKARIIRVAQQMGVQLAAGDIIIGPLPIPNTATVTSNRPLYGTIPITINYDMNKRRIIGREFYMPFNTTGSRKITLPIFDGPYTVSETVLMEGADV